MAGNEDRDEDSPPGLVIDLLRRDVRPGVGGRLRQPLARALGMGRAKRKEKPHAAGPPTVLDATAGAGMDTWLIAALGCRVLSLERNEEVFRAGRDALGRARDAMPDIADRITRRREDARTFLEELKREEPRAAEIVREALGRASPEVVYLDPMFPSERSAAEGKLLRATRAIVGDDADADRLLPAAFAVALRRVVVKRPRRGGALAGVAPTVSHIGKAVRYDVYAKADAAVIAAIEAFADSD